MQQNFDNITFLTGNADILDRLSTIPAKPTFDDHVEEFLAALSKELMSDPRSRKYPDVISYAFWIRKGSLETVKAQHTNIDKRIGRGVAFHIAPSNVPINFAVSMTSALLAGNSSVIRVSDKEYEQVYIITDAINKLLSQNYSDLSDYICLIRYPHNEDINKFLTSKCDIRIIWGGNRTIDTIRKAALPSRSIELSFADRHSVTVINADSYLDKKEFDKVAEGFYTDTYYTDQNACSSPRIVVWTGKQTDQARKIFWDKEKALAIQKYDLKPINVTDKLSAFYELAADHNGIHLVSDENYCVRVLVDKLFPDIMNYKCSGGYFFEYIADSLDEIVSLLTKPCQTVSYYGLNPDEIRDVVYKNGVRGVDRIVPVGSTMELSFTWDGYDMIEAMSRIVYVSGSEN